MKKQTMFVFSLMVVLSLLVTSCGQRSDPTSPPAADETAPPTAPEASEPVTIRFGFLSQLDTWLIGPIDEWEEATGNKVETSLVPLEQWLDKLMTDMQSGAGSYDVIFVDDSWLAWLGANGYVMPLDQFGYKADPDIPERLYQMGLWPDKLGTVPPAFQDVPQQAIAVPIMGHTELFLYRNDIITTPPATVDDLIAELEAKADPGNGLYGYVHRGLRGNPIVVDFLVWMWTYGGDVFDENWNCTLNEPETVEALQQYVDLVPLAPPGVANFNQDEVAAAILNGSSLAAFTWPILMGNVDDPEASRVSGKVGIMPFPKGEDQATLSGSWYLAVTATSDVGPQAYDFIEFLTSKESQMAEAVAGMPPMRKSVLTDPELVETHWWFPTTLEALDIARPRATFPEWPKVEDIFGTYLSKALIGDMTPQAAMDQACSEITDVITQAGYYE